MPSRRDVRPYFAAIADVSAIDLTGLPLPALIERARDLRARAEHEPLDGLLPSVFAVAREISQHTLGLRPFDVQMAAGVALARAASCSFATGEGKTLAAVAPAILQALTSAGRTHLHGERLSRRARCGVDGAALPGLRPRERRGD